MRTLILSLILITFPLAAPAQQQPILRLVVEDPGGEASRCGITRSSISSIAAPALNKNGVKVTTALAEAHLYVQVIASLIPGAGSCVFSNFVSVRASQPLPPGGIGGFKIKADNFADLSLCEKSSLTITSLKESATRFALILENDIKICLVELERLNDSVFPIGG